MPAAFGCARPVPAIPAIPAMPDVADMAEMPDMPEVTDVADRMAPGSRPVVPGRTAPEFRLLIASAVHRKADRCV